MAEVELSVSLTNLRKEVEQGLAPIAQLLNRLAQSKDLEVKLDPKGAEFFAKQIERLKGVAPEKAQALSEQFSELSRSFNKTLNLLQANKFTEASKSMLQTKQALEEFIKAANELSTSVSRRVSSFGKLGGMLKIKEGAGDQIYTVDPEKYRSFVKYLQKNYEAIVTQIDKKERDAVKALAESFLKVSSKKSDGQEFLQQQWGQQLLKSLAEADNALSDYVKGVAGTIKGVSKTLTQQQEQLLYDFEEKFKEALVGKGLKKLAPDIKTDNFSRILAFVRGSPEKLVDTLYAQIIKGTLGADMSVGLGAEALRDVVVTNTDKLVKFMRSNLMLSNEAAVQDLIKNGGQRVFPAIEEAVRIFSQQLLTATNTQIRATAQAIRKDPTRFQILEDSIVDMVADAIEGAAKFLDERGPNTNFVNQLQRAGVALMAREQADDNFYADFYKAGRQVRQQQLIDSYLSAFFPSLGRKLKELEMSTDPAVTMQAAKIRGKFVTNFGPSIDAAQGLLLNTLANFISGLGVAAVFGIGFTVAKYIQDMETLNKELQTYKNILQLNYEEAAAQQIEDLREELLELATVANVATQKVADLFGFFTRNNLAFDDLAIKQLAQTLGFISEAFAVPFDQLKEKIKTTLLEQRQRLIGPEQLNQVVEVGGPQADKALDLFSKLMSSSKTIGFSVEEIAKATRYYLDTGKDVVDNYYDIARAVEYGTKKYEEHSKRLEKVAENYRNVDITNLLGFDRENRRFDVQEYQRRIGLLISRSGQDALGNIGIGGPSVALASLQTSLLGLVELIRQATKLVGMILDATGPLGNLVRALAGQAGLAITIALVASFFRLMNNFLKNIGKSTKEFTDELFKAFKVDPKDAKNLEKTLKDSKGVIGRLSGSLAALIEGLTLFGRVLLRFLGPAGIVAAVLTTVGAITLQAEKQKQERIAKGQEVDRSVVRGFSESGNVVVRNTDGKLTEVDLSRLGGLTEAQIIAAFSDEQLRTPSAEIIRRAVNAARNLNKAITSSAEKKILADLEALGKELDKAIQEVVDANPGKSEAELNVLINKDKKVREINDMMRKASNQLSDAFDAMIDEKVGQIQELVKTLYDWWSKGRPKKMSFEELVTNNRDYQSLMRDIQILQSQRELLQKVRPLADLGEALAAFDDTTKTVNSLLQAALKALDLNKELLTAPPDKAPFIKLQAQLNAIRAASSDLTGQANAAAIAKATNEVLAQYAQEKQAVRQRERALLLEAAQILPSDFARLNELLRIKQQDVSFYNTLIKQLKGRGASLNNPALVEAEFNLDRAKLEVEQQKKAIYAFEQELARARAQVNTRLFQSIEEVFFPAKGGNTATARLMQTVNQLVQESMNLPLDQFINMQKAIFEGLDNIRPLAETYDRQVTELERAFKASRRATKPEERFRNIQAFIDKGIQMVESGKLLTGASARFVELLSDQLFTDGGQLSQLQQYTSQGLSKLEQLSRKNRPNDLSAQIVELANGYVEVATILGNLVQMEATFKQNVERLKEVGKQVFGQSTTNLRNLLQKYQVERKRLEEKARRGKLTYQEEALLKSYVDEAKRLETMLNIETELAKARNELAALRSKGGKTEADLNRMRALTERVAKLESQITNSKLAFNAIIAQSDEMLNEVVEQVTTFAQKLNEALSGVVLNLNDYSKDLKEKLEQIVKSFKRRAEAFRPQSFKEDQIARLDEEFADFRAEFAKTQEDLIKLSEDLKNSQKQISGKALRERIEKMDTTPDKSISKALLSTKINYNNTQKTLDEVLKTLGDGSVSKIYSELLSLIDNTLNSIKDIYREAKKRLEAAKVEIQYNELLEKANNLLRRAKEEQDAGNREEAEALLKEAAKTAGSAESLLNTQKAVLFEGGSTLSALNEKLNDIKRELKGAEAAFEAAKLESSFKAFRNNVEEFEKSLEGIENLTKERIQDRVGVLDTLLNGLKQLEKEVKTNLIITPADRENFLDQIKSLYEQISRSTVQLAQKALFDTTSFDAFKKSVEQYGLSENVVLSTYTKIKEADIRKTLAEVNNASNVKDTETVEEVEAAINNLNKLLPTLTELKEGPIKELIDLGIEVEELTKAVDGSFKSIQDIIKTLEDKKLALQETKLRDVIRDADNELKNAVAAGANLAETLETYVNAVKALAEFGKTINDEKRKREIDQDVQNFLAGLASLSGLGIDSTDWVKIILGIDDPVAFVKTLNLDLSQKTQPGLANEIANQLKTRGFDVTASVAALFAKALLDAADKTIADRIEQLTKEIEDAAEKIDETLAGGDEAAAKQALKTYIAAIDALVNYGAEVPNPNVQADVKRKVNKALSELPSKSGMGITDAQWLKILLGVDDPLTLIRELNASLSSDTNPQLVAKVTELLSERGIEVSATTAQRYAKLIVDAAIKQVEKERKALEAKINAAGLDLTDAERNLQGILANIQLGKVGDLAAVFDALKALQKLSEQLTSLQIMSAEYDKDDPNYANRLREIQNEHKQRVENYINQVVPVLNAIERAYETGQIGYDAALQAVENLQNSLTVLAAFIDTIAAELNLSEQEKSLLKKSVSELAAATKTSVSKLLSEPLRLLTGEFSSLQLSFRQEAKRVFAQTLDNRGAEGAASALYSLPAQWLQSVASRPFFTMPWAGEEGRIQAQRNLIMQALRLDDMSLAQMFFGEEDAKRLALNAEQLREAINYLRAGLRGLLRDLEEQDLKRLEALLINMVQQLQSGIESLFTSLLNIPAQMLRDQYQHEETMRRLNDRKAALEDERAMYQKLYDEAVKNFGATSSEAEKYREKLAEVTQAQREWRDEFKRAEESAKSFFDYVLDALGQFLRMLSEALIRYAANYAAQAVMGLVFGSAGGAGGVIGASGGVMGASVGAAGGMALASAAPPAASATMSGVTAVGQTLTSAAITSVGGELASAAALPAAIANPVVALGAAVAGMAIAAATEEIGRWFDKNRFTFKEGKNKFADMPSALDYYPNARPTVININAAFERQQLVREASKALDKKLRDEQV
jgi:DNA repair exonuclease SbcCD ATPase subunit